MYDLDQLKSVRANYKAVQKSFQLIDKPYREGAYWTPEEFNACSASVGPFRDSVTDTMNFAFTENKDQKRPHLRPVIALYVG